MTYSPEIRQRALILYQSGLTYYVVARNLGIRTEAVFKWCKEAGIGRSIGEALRAGPCPPETRKKISAALTRQPKTGYHKATAELAYIVGVVVGDGHPSREGKVVLHVKDWEFADAFGDALEKQFGGHISKFGTGDGCLRVQLASHIATDFLRSIISTDWVMSLPPELKISWLRGLWDSEGSISWSGNKCCVALGMMNEQCVFLYSSILELMGIHTRPHVYNRVWTVTFAGLSDVVRFYGLVQPTIKRKRHLFDQAKTKLELRERARSGPDK